MALCIFSILNWLQNPRKKLLIYRKQEKKLLKNRLNWSKPVLRESSGRDEAQLWRVQRFLHIWWEGGDVQAVMKGNGILSVLCETQKRDQFECSPALRDGSRPKSGSPPRWWGVPKGWTRGRPRSPYQANYTAKSKTYLPRALRHKLNLAAITCVKPQW